MALTFIVEDGTGVPNATSYLTVQEADDQLGLNPHNNGWESQPIEIKQQLLMWATQVLNHSIKWFGRKTKPENSLAWPREGAHDCEGYPISTTTVPYEVKEATAILANTLLEESNNPAAIDQLANFKRIKVDVIELEFKDGFGYKEKIPSYLSRVLCGLGRVVGHGGHRFVPLRKV